MHVIITLPSVLLLLLISYRRGMASHLFVLPSLSLVPSLRPFEDAEFNSIPSPSLTSLPSLSGWGMDVTGVSMELLLSEVKYPVV